MPDDTTKKDAPTHDELHADEEKGHDPKLTERAQKVAQEVGSVLNETGRKLMEEFRALGKREGDTGDGLGGEIQDKLKALSKDVASLLDSIAAKASTDLKKVSRGVREGLADAIHPDKKKKDKPAGDDDGTPG